MQEQTYDGKVVPRLTIARLVTSVVDGRLAPGAKPQKDMMQAFINSGMTRAELTQQVFVQM